MSPLAQSLLSTPQDAAPATAAEIEDALVEALLCSDEPGSLDAEAFLGRVDGQFAPGVHVMLHGARWTITGKSARAVMRRIEVNRETRVGQRQNLRLAADTLDRISKHAAVLVYVAQSRTAH